MKHYYLLVIAAIRIATIKATSQIAKVTPIATRNGASTSHQPMEINPKTSRTARPREIQNPSPTMLNLRTDRCCRAW